MSSHEMRGVTENRVTVKSFFFDGEEEGMVADHWMIESEEALASDPKVHFIEYYTDDCEIMTAQVIRVEGDDSGDYILLEI